MATTIVTKKGSGAPAASDLVEGELAVDTTNGRLYTENSSAAVVELGSNPSGNITFGDNGKAIFGAGSDLEILSNGTDGLIRNGNATGEIRMESDDRIIFADRGFNEVFAVFNDDDDVKLYHDGNQKLATTATGIDVTGSVTADGLTVSPSGTQQVLATLRANSGAGGGLVVQTDASDDGLIRGYDSSGAVQIQLDTDGGDNYIAKGNVGIGTASPSSVTHLVDDTSTVYDATAYQSDLTIERKNTSGSNQSAHIRFNVTGYEGSTTGEASIGAVQTANASSADLVFTTRNAGTRGERMRIDASGNLGLGITPSAWGSLWKASEIGLGAGFGGRTNGTQADVYENLYRDATNVYKYKTSAAASVYTQVVGNYIWSNAGVGTAGATATLTERMRIDSLGNVGIGVVPATTQTLTAQITNGLSLFGNNTTPYGFISNNHVWATGTGDKYLVSNYGASYYKQYSGVHTWATAPSGTAGNAITFTPAMTLDASGNLLVGTTSAFGTTGTTINAAGLVYSSADGDRSGQFDRTTSDGEVVRFTKAGSTVGSIGTVSGYLYVGGTAGDDAFLSFGANGVRPSTSAGAARDAAIDLGGSSNRFKDLYLSESVKLSANDAGGAGSNSIDFAHTNHTSGPSAQIHVDYTSDFRANLLFKINKAQSNSAPTEVARFTNGGNLLVGTTSSSGDTANNKPVVAGNFTTKYGVTSIPSVNTWTTVHTFGSNEGNFMVSMRASGTGNIADNSVSIVAINGTATTSTSLLAGSSVQIRIVGLTLQVYQNVFAGANINWSIMSIGN